MCPSGELVLSIIQTVKAAFFKRDMNFCAVRGELTRKAVEKMRKKRLDIPTADAGILAVRSAGEPSFKAL